MKTRGHLKTELGFLTVLIFCGLASQAWAIEQAARTEAGATPPASLELGRPADPSSWNAGVAPEEDRGALQTASLIPARPVIGSRTVDAELWRGMELNATLSRSSLHLGPGSLSRSFACDVQILPIPLSLAGSERADGLTLVAL